MPALKLTEELFFEDAIRTFEFDRKGADGCGIEGFNEVLNARNAKEQIEILKKLTKIITARINKEHDSNNVEKSFQFLTSLLFITTSKNPIRRFLKSYFLGLPSSVQEYVIKREICRFLHLMFKGSFTASMDHTSQRPLTVSSDNASQKLDTANAENIAKLSRAVKMRHNIDTVASLIENFSLGEQCIQEVCEQLLPYLTYLQEQFYNIFCMSGLSPVQQNEVMHHVLETVKLINRICQKSVVAMETMKSKEYLETDSYFPSKLFRIDSNVLLKDSFLLDCKTTCSMNIWLLLKQLASTEVLLSMASKSIFSGVDWLVESCYFREIPDWLTKLFCESLSGDEMSNSSYLCCCYGFLAIVAMETLTQTIKEKCLLLDCLLDKFLELSQSCTDTAGKLLAAKSISLLVLRIRDFCNQGNLSPFLKKRLHGEFSDMKKVLQFVWTTWEHSVDAIRFTVKDIFENVVTVHLYCSNVPVKEDPFLLQLLASIMQDVSWSCKGKYPTLSVLVGHLGSTRMLQMHPGIAGEVLKQLQEQTLACYGSDLYEKLFKSHKYEMETSADVDGVTWCDYWLKPVLDVLCGTNKLQKKHTIEYVLPRILNCEPFAMQYIIPKLSTQNTDSGNLHNEDGQLGALIMCLRRARALGQLRDNKLSNHATNDMWCSVVDVKLLQQALVCKDEQIRLDALALLCENQKTSEVIGATELRLIKCFIPDNLTNQNPAFRQHFLSLLKKFLYRMKESSCALLKKINKDKQSASAQTMYKDFLSWLTRCLFNSLYPGSVFARRSTCLEALFLLMTQFGSTNSGMASELQFNIFTEVTPSDVNSLLFCITDTFEDNKNIAATILIACTKQSATEIVNESQCKLLFEIGLSLSESTRPQDSMTASYLLSVLVHQPCMFKLLQHELSASGAETETVTAGKHETCSKDENATSEDLADVSHEISVGEKQRSHDAINTGKNGSGNILNDNDESTEASDQFLMLAEDSELCRRYLLLTILMQNLKLQTEIAKKSLIVAAANKPLYPTIQCMRHCFSDVNFNKIPEREMAAWRNLLARFVSLCSEISRVVSPVVCNSSPEGNVPMEALEGMENLGAPGNENVTRSHETVTLMPEYLIVCCWRSVKEMSLLLGQLTANVPIATGAGNQGLLNYDQIMVIRDFFQRLLLESKHRGAFELAYAGFVKLTDMLWKNSNPALHELPVQLLSEVMADIRSNDVNSRLCATRRSAGVPFYVQALVSTEPLSTGRQCFKKTMEELLCLGLDETVVTQDKCTAKVHALNILRALFKDSKLRDDVAPYVADGLKVAILGFKSPLWAVRNSATLLMTAMMTRIFGVKRSKDESTFNRKNCQTGRTFFYHYPCLYQFLLDEIIMATEHVTSQLHPGLYPILMVLGRLFPSSMEGTDTSLNISAFIPYVVKCSGNPVLKTRVMAAKAIQPLVDKDHVTIVFRDLLTSLPCQQTDSLNQNQIHGILLQISKLFETVPTLPVTLQTSLSELIGEKWNSIMECLITRKNACLLTREVTLNLTFNFIRQFQCFTSFLPMLCDTLVMEINDLDTAYDACMPALSQFQATVCTLWCDLYFMTGTENLSVSDNCDISFQKNTVCDNAEFKGSSLLRTYLKSYRNSEGSDLQTETLVLRLLRSRSYEVREIILKKMSILSDTSDNGLHLNRSADELVSSDDLVIKQDSKGQGHSLLTTLTMSEDIQSCLLSMIEIEDNEECQIELVSLLGKWWGSYITCDDRKMKLVSVVHTMVVKMRDEKCSDALTSAKITFLGAAIYHFLSACLSPGNMRLVKDTVLKEAVDGFIQVVQGHTSQVETSADILLACAQSLLKNCDYLLGTSKQLVAHYIEDDLVTLVFRSVLDLLQADDIEVRETASTIVHSVTRDNSSMIVSHPYVAVSNILEHWVKHSMLSDSARHLSTLFDIVFENREGSQDYEERLFDRGEINTYWDELDFLQRLNEAINECTNTSSIKAFKDMAVNEQQQQLGQEKLKQIPIGRNDDIICAGNFTLPTYKTIFLDTHIFQAQVFTLYKQYIARKYSEHISRTGYKVEKGDDVYTDILTNSQEFDRAQSVWPSVLVHCMNKINL